MANKIALDVDDFYEPSDSDVEYTEREKTLLKKLKTNRKSKDENEDVLAFDDEDEDTEGDDDEFDDEDAGNDSDFEQNDIAIPDDRAWGRKRGAYFSTDFVDQDYSSYTAAEEKLAEEEELEARALQERLAKQLNESDFTLDVYGSGETKTDTLAAKTWLRKDFSDLSHREKCRLFKKDSPEFDGLVKDFEARLNESIGVLEPALKWMTAHGIAEQPIGKFVQTLNATSLNYCTNIAFYVMLKAKRTIIKNHPIVKRLFQLRQILLQLDGKYERAIKPQLTKLLQHNEMGDEILFGADNPTPNGRTKKVKNSVIPSSTKSSDMESDDENSIVQEPSNDDTNVEKLRRQITYQIMKNKGLTPHRKKELRNPRVKHRGKYRKALIRRKGAIRTVRTETERYAGEVSGIKATTKKGIQIK